MALGGPQGTSSSGTDALFCCWDGPGKSQKAPDRVGIWGLDNQLVAAPDPFPKRVLSEPLKN